jgi:hypothetical protein
MALHLTKDEVDARVKGGIEAEQVFLRLRHEGHIDADEHSELSALVTLYLSDLYRLTHDEGDTK